MQDPTPTQPDPDRRLPLRPLTVAAVGFLLVLLAVAGIKSYRDLATVRRQETALIERVDDTQQRIEVLQRRIERLRHDPATLERLAREELGMVRPGDLVIVLPAAETAEPTQSAGAREVAAPADPGAPAVQE